MPGRHEATLHAQHITTEQCMDCRCLCSLSWGSRARDTVQHPDSRHVARVAFNYLREVIR